MTTRRQRAGAGNSLSPGKKANDDAKINCVEAPTDSFATVNISSCSKLTDTINLAGVLYIFATILCALSGCMQKSHRSRSPLRSLFGLWHAARNSAQFDGN